MILECNACSTKFELDALKLGREGRVVRCAECGNLWHEDPPKGTFPELPPEPEGPVEDLLAARLGAMPEPVLPESSKRDDAWPLPGEAPEQADDTWALPHEGGHAEAEAGGRGDSGLRPLSKLRAMTDRPSKNRKRGERKAVPWQRWAALAAGLVAVVVLVASASDRVIAIWPATAKLYAMLGMGTPLDALGLQPKDARSFERMTPDGPVLVVEGRLLNTAAEARRIPRLFATVRVDGKEVGAFSFTTKAPMIAPGESVPFRGELPNPPPAGKTVKLDFHP